MHNSSLPIVRASIRGSIPTDSERLYRSTGVLIVDDDDALRGILARMLRKYGAKTWSAANGLEGVQTFHRFSKEIDLVVADVQMPLLDGFETLLALRRLNPDVRCCLMSGDDGDEILERATLAKPYRFFTKPFNLMDVVGLLFDVERRSIAERRIP